MFGLRIKALKDDARVLGLVLKAGHELDLDILPMQAAAVLAAVESGDLVLLKGAEFIAPAPAPEPVKAAKK